ncbi:general secretion pathway protein GspB [Piscinibacter terrae]|uniref:General secretion pathway protein n=1 Tax=Piscinibacter terrae TaxID=2496871 RepID=A0A3N7HUQ4_9BURK|nr:general secretion pathway protein GspB [Albitalea terrae]RQP26078.1 general secretion pathway protein [Albitalea terrae]
MSYILDALRRADAERERGSVPSIHAQSVLPGASEAREGRGTNPMVWVVAGLSLALLASLAWQWLGREPVREPVAATEPAPAAMPVNMAPVNAGAAPDSSRVAPTPARTPTLPPVPATAQQSLPPVPAATTVQAPAAAAKPAPTASAARLPTQDELPEDLRRQIPKFAVGGSIYSESAASRFIILNGQIFHENDKVLPDLVLEQIKLKSAVLRFRNQRFTISF